VLADDIGSLLAPERGEGLTAAELARLLEVPESQVEFTLLSSHGRFRSDRGSPSRWWPARATVSQSRGEAPTQSHGSGLNLYPWQRDALEAWQRRGGRGVVEAVTGTGKTRVGVAAVLDELSQRGQAVVLVPTLELQNQWLGQLEALLPASRSAGRMGSGGGDDLASHDVVVAVVNSARSMDLRPIRQGGLLVADECHRYGSSMNRLALDQRFRHRLGLSATYAREDDGNRTWLDPYFGGTCFRLGYARAKAEGITARFTVSLVGVAFSPEERAWYDELTERLGALGALLVKRYRVPADPFTAFLLGVRDLAEAGGEGSGMARTYLQAMRERRQLLAETPAKDEALRLVAPGLLSAQRSIVFTQSIAVAERACRTLSATGLRVAAIHSHLAGPLRRQTLAAFAAGELDVITAPRVLDEGIDVPAADLAVIVGASRSRRQMVQRMGRILRRKPDGRRARFVVLFVEGTVEDPRGGAHEAFLEEIVDVADEVLCFTPGILAGGQDELLQALRP